MTPKKQNQFLCIHGHFYQPPRENPWTGKTEQEESAAPFHDWNERIFNECYKPNTEAVIVDDKGKVIKRVNNYEYLNFNFGPTLMEWIRSNHKETFQRIIDADKVSREKHNGFGNAIAQAYNHTILPLSNRKDKITQIKQELNIERRNLHENKTTSNHLRSNFPAHICGISIQRSQLGISKGKRK